MSLFNSSTDAFLSCQQFEPKVPSFPQRDLEVLCVFHNVIHSLSRQFSKPLAILDLRTPPIPLLGRHNGSRDDAAMRVGQKQCQYISVPWFRRGFELEWSHSMLKGVGEGTEPSLSGHDSTYSLHFGSLLLDAVEFFDALMVISSSISFKSLAVSTRSL